MTGTSEPMVGYCGSVCDACPIYLTTPEPHPSVPPTIPDPAVRSDAPDAAGAAAEHGAPEAPDPAAGRRATDAPNPAAGRRAPDAPGAPLDALAPPLSAGPADCDGCRAGGRLLADCEDCEIRCCAREHDVSTCTECDDFPCDRLRPALALERSTLGRRWTEPALAYR